MQRRSDACLSRQALVRPRVINTSIVVKPSLRWSLRVPVQPPIQTKKGRLTAFMTYSLELEES